MSRGGRIIAFQSSEYIIRRFHKDGLASGCEKLIEQLIEPFRKKKKYHQRPLTPDSTNFKRPFTPQTWLGSASNFAKSAFQTIPGEQDIEQPMRSVINQIIQLRINRPHNSALLQQLHSESGDS